MPSLKEVKTRIESVSSTRQITQAMKMVAASKLRKAQNNISTLRPYAEKFIEIMDRVWNSLDEENTNTALSEERPPENILVVCVTSNRGLCGAFNMNVIKQVNRLIHETYQQQLQNNQLRLMCIGKKGGDFFKNKKIPLSEAADEQLIEHVSFEKTAPLANRLMEDFLNNKYDRVVIVYNQFKNAAVQILRTEQLLPLVKKDNDDQETNNSIDYIFEPGKDELLKELGPYIVKVHLYQILQDSYAAEQGARMTAMHKATDNATELIKELKLTYNKARQAAITKEISEIVGGAEALKG